MNSIEEIRKKDMDTIIEELREGHIRLDGAFELQFDYIDENDDRFLPAHRGFSMTAWPKGRDGNAIVIKFDPYDIEICSGVAEVIKEHERKNK